MRYAPVRLLVAAVAMSMTLTEFIEVQKLGPDELRARFRLPRACDPALTALTSEPARNLVTVAVECRAKPAGTPTPPLPRERH